MQLLFLQLLLLQQPCHESQNFAHMGHDNTLLSSAIATRIMDVVKAIAACTRALIEWALASSGVTSFSNLFSFGWVERRIFLT
jgi:hypothetical protein